MAARIFWIFAVLQGLFLSSIVFLVEYVIFSQVREQGRK